MGRGHFHAAEFIELKMGFMIPHSFLLEQNRPGIVCFDDHGDDKHRQRQHDNPEKGKDDIDQSFNKMLIHNITPVQG